jgi:hypothetical protein
VIERVMLRRDVLLAALRSGGTLLDLSGDRFIALSPLSTVIWRSLSARESNDAVIKRVADFKRIADDDAALLVKEQLRAWSAAHLLIDDSESSRPLPATKPTGVPAWIELDQANFRMRRIRPLTVATLVFTEASYRRRIKRIGLAASLAEMQQETRASHENPELIVETTLRAYYALRRGFRQGNTARDCLFRSIALVAVLHRRGVRADLCIGVTDLPFTAHAWVEWDSRVLNDGVAKVAEHVVIGRF